MPSEIVDTDSFYVTCKIFDESGIYDDNTDSEGQGVYIRWGYDENVSEGKIQMSLQESPASSSRSKTFARSRNEGEMFITPKIPPQPSGKAFYYIVYAYDNDFDNGNIDDRIQGVSDLQILDIVDDDTEPPTFSNFLPVKIPVDESFFILCDITDSTGVYHQGDLYDVENPQSPFTVTLVWDDDGSLTDGSYERVEMQPKGDHTTSSVTTTFQTINLIPAQTVGSEFVYVVYACDNDIDFDNIDDIEFGSSLINGEPQQVHVYPVDNFTNAYVYPNPAPTNEFANEIHFRYYIEENGTDIYIQVFDVLGDLIWEAEEFNLAYQDYRETVWNINDIASGLYVYRIEATAPSGTKEVIKKLAIAK